MKARNKSRLLNIRWIRAYKEALDLKLAVSLIELPKPIQGLLFS